MNFSKNKTIYNLFKKSASEKTPLTLYGMKADIFFLHFQKKLKNICSHLLWSENAKFFPENWRKNKMF